MILATNNGGEVWLFTDEECADYAYICACMPIDRLTVPEADLVRTLEVKFRIGRGGFLTQRQWNWFALIAERNAACILDQGEAVSAIRQLAAGI